MDVRCVDPIWLMQFDRPVPRYTSYPTAPQFRPVGQEFFLETLKTFDRTQKPLSLYLHIPFCKTMCLFCGCSVVLNRQPERQERYVRYLLQEIEQTSRLFSKKREVVQIHLGGGTPTSLTIGQLDVLMECLRRSFHCVADAEISIEIDPRTVFEDKGIKLTHLRRLGFNRVSFGVQDLDPAVQEAVRRRQSEEMTVSTYLLAKELGFEGINIDLIYGLPLQTAASFQKTTDKLLILRPDRIAFYSYAKIPWLKPHQKAIADKDLPSTAEKFQIYLEARNRFLDGGYFGIGMDHFAQRNDSLAKAYLEKKLTRNFQGYSVQCARDMLGFGVSAIGFLEERFFQNDKTLEGYEAKLSQGRFPILLGFDSEIEDVRRRWVIQMLMCHFELDKREFTRFFSLDFDAHFCKEKAALEALEQEGLLAETKERITPTPLGRLFIRLIASAFDAYLDNGRFSRAV